MFVWCPSTIRVVISSMMQPIERGFSAELEVIQMLGVLRVVCFITFEY